MLDSLANRCIRAQQITGALAGLYPDSHCALQHQGPWQLLVATILSAQCTDARVNLVTPALFKRYPDSQAMALAEAAELEKFVQSTGFFRNKTKNLLACCQALVERHGGAVPSTLEELVLLPGVGRKTAMWCWEPALAFPESRSIPMWADCLAVWVSVGLLIL